MDTTKPGADPALFPLTTVYVGNWENWSINIRVDCVPDSVVVHRRDGELGCKRCQEGFGARISFNPNRRTWKPYPTRSSGIHVIYAPAMGGLTSIHRVFRATEVVAERCWAWCFCHE